MDEVESRKKFFEQFGKNFNKKCAKQMDELDFCMKLYKQLGINLDKMCAMPMAELESRKKLWMKWEEVARTWLNICPLLMSWQLQEPQWEMHHLDGLTGE